MVQIDIEENIYKLVKTYPTIKEIMVELGFKDIIKPGLLQSVGRLMTIEKGCMMNDIDFSEAKVLFEENGFEFYSAIKN